MSYPAYIHTEELNRYGFDINPDNQREAISRLHPTLSFRYQCDKCGVWSSAFGGLHGMFCVRCNSGKTPHQITRQTYKLYLCCTDHECELRHRAFQFLSDYGLELVATCHDGYGEYVDLAPIKELGEEEQEHFFLQLNNFTVSKFRARKMTHPGKPARSKLPKSS